MSSSKELKDYLPSILQEDKFLTEYLSAFEKVFIAPKVDKEPASLEAIIAGIARYFDPLAAPEEFLPWLARWTAFSLRADLTVAQQRAFLARIISLYSKRGTAANLQTFLEIFTGGTPTIIDGERLKERADSGSGKGEGYEQWEREGKLPHSFVVELSFLELYKDEKTTSKVIERKLEIARALIHMEKPAHTRCYLNPIFITMKLPKADDDREAHSRIEVDTLLGDYPPKLKGRLGGKKKR